MDDNDHEKWLDGISRYKYDNRATVMTTIF